MTCESATGTRALPLPRLRGRVRVGGAWEARKRSALGIRRAHEIFEDTLSIDIAHCAPPPPRSPASGGGRHRFAFSPAARATHVDGFRRPRRAIQRKALGGCW